MKGKIIMQNTKWRILVFVFSLSAFYFSLFTYSEAKIYIDIANPGTKQLSVGVFDFPGPQGQEISRIVREDLTFTGLFTCADKAAFIEADLQPFDPKNWTPLGIEAVVKGNVVQSSPLTVTVSLYDTFEGKELFAKQYRSDRGQMRKLAHGISADIYAAFTGKPAMFMTRIAFVGEEKGVKGIYLMDWDGDGMKRIGIKGSLVLSPRWSSDGTKLIYSSERGRQWGIYLLNFQRMTEKRIFVSRGTNLAGDFFPNGNSLAFSSSKDGTPDLYIYNIGDKVIRKITSTHGIDVSPSVSSDGSRIAFVSDRGGSPQIYVMQADGSDVRRVTFQGSYNTAPAWSPSGDRIAFSGRRSGRNQIFIVKPDGSGLTQLTDNGNNEDPSFSPDGRYITFSSDRDRSKGIYIMRANGESQRRITPKGVKAFGPRWSPN
jgi:TolB protein